MSDAPDFIEEVWQEMNLILQDLADSAVLKEIVRSLLLTLERGAAWTTEIPTEQRARLLQAARDLSVDHLRAVARHDPSTPKRQRARELLLAFFEPRV